MGCWKIIYVRNAGIKIYDMVCRIGRVCWRVCGVGG